MRRKILSLEFEGGHWSWGIISRHLCNAVHDDFDFMSTDFGLWRKADRPSRGEDIILSQNVVQLEYIYDKDKSKTIARMGGNRSFDDRPFPTVQRYLEQMQKCFAVVATNQHLTNIGKLVNPNTHLISNGIDLEKWIPRMGKVWHRQCPIVGFIGNVATEEKAHYKGWPILQAACAEMGLALRPALYKQKQIPHQDMIRDFYYQIDVLVLPTAGEGSNNSLMEELALGIPVITTKCAGYHGENMEHGVNVLFCERNVESIKEQLRTLMYTPRMFETLSKGGREFAEKHHDIRIIANQYRQLFNSFFKKENNDERKQDEI